MRIRAFPVSESISLIFDSNYSLIVHVIVASKNQMILYDILKIELIEIVSAIFVQACREVDMARFIFDLQNDKLWEGKGTNFIHYCGPIIMI